MTQDYQGVAADTTAPDTTPVNVPDPDGLSNVTTLP